jgi:ABC-type Fe3+ transport system substrate-binding protein
MRNWLILLLLGAIVALPFLFHRNDGTRHWLDGHVTIVVVTPHNEAIRYEFERAFSRWHEAKYGKPVRIDWRVIGGTTEISRYLTSEYASAAKFWWEGTLKREWPPNATERVTSDKVPTDDPKVLEVYNQFRATDDPDVLSSRIDVFFGGGEFDHSNANRQGLTVAPWKPGEEPKGLFVDPTGVAMIPEKVSGETWRTPYLFGNVISTFGICYNVDRLRELGVATPPARWDDLADYRYYGQVGAVDPSKSGSVAKAFEMMIHQKVAETVRSAGFSDEDVAKFENLFDAAKKAKGAAHKPYETPEGVPPEYQQAVERGWLAGVHLVQQIGANARYFTDSASKAPVDVSVGDAAVAMCIDFYGRFQAQSSRGPHGEERMGYLTPVGGSSVSCDPISLLRGAGGGADNPDARRERRQVAIRFIEFALSEAGQKLWCYRPGETESGGPEKFALRRLPIRRDFYPSTNPTIQARHAEHLKHVSDDLADPRIDAYKLAQQFVYYPRWTGSHFGVQRDLVRAMCLDAGDELRDAWRKINDAGGPSKQPAAMEQLGLMPRVPLYNRATRTTDTIELTWRNAPDVTKKYDKLDVTREWTKFFRQSYRKAAGKVTKS